MSYRGQTIAISGNRGGFYNSPNIDLIPQEMMVDSTKNINLHEDIREKRGGTAQVRTGHGAAQIMGGFDFTMIDGTQFNMVGTADGKIWKDASTVLHTFATSDQYISFEVMNNKLYIFNGADIPQVWDGAAGATTDLGVAGETAPTALTGALVADIDGLVEAGDHSYKVTFINAFGETEGGTTSDVFEVFGIAPPGACTDDLAGAGAGNVDDGAHSYKITFVTSSGETDGGTASAGVTVADKSTDGKVALTAIPTGSAGVTARKIYRTVAGDTGDYKLVDTIADNVTTTYEDDTADAGLGAVTPTDNGTSGQVALTAIPAGPAGVTSRKIYRTVTGDGGNHKLLTTLSDNTTTTYTDNTADASLGADVPTTNTAALRPTDWSGLNHPTHVVIHGKGASERMWAIGAKPNIIYASKLNDGTTEADFSDSQVITIQIETSDGFGIVAGIEFGDKLICFSKKRAYIIDDESSDTSLWGYAAAQWTGGVAHYRVLVRTPNDLFAMMEDGEVYSIITAQQFGDYKEASISRPAFMDKWLREKARFTDIEKFHATFDPELRLIKWFIVRAGQTTVDTALVYYLDRADRYGAAEAWMRHDNQSNDSGYSASASWNFRKDPPEDHRDYIYTGDYVGVIWDLEEVNRNDNSTAFTGAMKTPHMTFGDARIEKKFRRGWITATAQGPYDLTVNKWVDGVQLSSSAIDLSGTGTALNVFLLDTDVLGGGELINKSFDIGAKGKRLQLEFVNSGVDENFAISQIFVDVKPLGKMAQ
jgi:hypothetical protein